MNGKLSGYIRQMKEKGASDLHIGEGRPAMVRIDEKLIPIDTEVFSSKDVDTAFDDLLNDEQKKRFERQLELDMSFQVEDVGRFRVNFFKQRGKRHLAFRLIPFEVMTFEECGLPVSLVERFCHMPKGLVLVTGATGSGKSTTLASMINKINEERPCHIVTVEDPIEFAHENKKAIVDQREVLNDTHSFQASLKHVLRQDPDVVLIGEMRDLETIESALIIAETGHLVFATLHTSDCSQTINRIVDVFPSHQQQQIKIQLSFVLQGVLSQQLLPKAEGRGRALAVEVLVAQSAGRALIRESKIHQLYSVIQTGQKDGMRTMNQALADLYAQQKITYETALERTTDPQELIRLIGPAK